MNLEILALPIKMFVEKCNVKQLVILLTKRKNKKNLKKLFSLKIEYSLIKSENIL